jgi:hypothetical protein
LASLADWYYGRQLAHKECRFKSEVAAYGWHAKGGVLLSIMIIRGIEAWLTGLPEPFAVDTQGFISAAIAISVICDELDSVDDNLRALGGRGIPLISPLLHWLRNASERFAGVLPRAQGQAPAQAQPVVAPGERPTPEEQKEDSSGNS